LQTLVACDVMEKQRGCKIDLIEGVGVEGRVYKAGVKGIIGWEDMSQ